MFLPVVQAVGAFGELLLAMRPERFHVIGQALEDLEQVLDTKNACELTGTSRATLYRRRHPRPRPAGPPTPRPVPPNALSRDERHRVLETLNSYRFVDKSPPRVWVTLLDEGLYLCSISTMYRLLRAEDGVRERRLQPRAPPFGDRPAHPGLGAPRHRGRDPYSAGRHAGGRLPGQP
ncbi:hypothetical protein [Streptosporangium amethystogenes]|uniref:hypothetical protein n=1 Tax=Streptosporangium amethystogenes TaxID=2002 RepID=UPI001FE0AE1C|nr:hypothetical protein [Streptosporangium amethystogenes]